MTRVGIIGTGSIAFYVHIPELKKLPDCKITAICDINEEQLKKVGDMLGLDEAHRFTDYRELIACPDVDAVEICTPNHLHVPIALEAVRAGKAFESEKPLACNVAQTRQLKKALEEKPVPNMMCFSYRFRPATRYAKHIIEEGLIGEIINVDVAYLKSSAFMEGRRLEWRFIKEYAGTGVLGDLGVHLIDLTEYLLGDFESVCGDTAIIIKERKKLDSEELGQVETDDYCSFLAKLTSGVRASFMITRCALGQRNTIKFDIYGTKGLISFNLNDPNTLGVCIGEVDRECNGLHTVQVPASYALAQERAFIDVVNGKNTEAHPSVKEGIACQKILDAVLLSSEEKRWVDIDSL